MTSLSLLIANYRAGIDDYNTNAPLNDLEAENAYADISYGPPLDAIMSFDGAATSVSEALIALELAEEESQAGDLRMVEALVRAAKLYLREVTPC